MTKMDHYAIAKNGGRHSGWLKAVVMNMGSRQIRKSIASLDDQIRQHEAWIANPTLKPGVAGKSEREISALRDRKWPSDIERHRQQKAILEGRLKELEQ